MRSLLFALTLALCAAGCKTFEIQRDGYDGSRIIEYSFIAADKGEADVLYSLDLKFQKTLRKNGEQLFRIFFHAVGNAYMALRIEPKITLRIDGRENIAPVINLAYAGERSGGADHKGYIETGIPYLHIRGEIDAAPLREQLANAEALVFRIQREGKSAVFVASPKEVMNIRKLMVHSGEE